jgi:hypothetical protein
MSREKNNTRREKEQISDRCYSVMRNTRSVSSKERKKKKRYTVKIMSCELLFFLYIIGEVCSHREKNS